MVVRMFESETEGDPEVAVVFMAVKLVLMKESPP